jgi:hypothetical protein
MGLAVVGTGGFIVGLVIAFREGATTEVIGASAALMILAFLDNRWESIRGRVGNVEFEVMARALQRSEESVESVESEIGALKGEPGVPPQLRERLESISERTRESTATSVRELVTVLGFATDVTEDRVVYRLHLFVRVSMGDITCTVGEFADSSVDRYFVPTPAAGDAEVRLAGRRPVQPGNYTVEWRWRPSAEGHGLLLARDRLVIS